MNSDEQINFYGIIIDAGHPYKSQNKFICTIKVIDKTLHSIKEGENKRVIFGLITFFAKKLEDLPVVRKIGDVLRIHRATVKEFKGTK